MDSLGEQAVVTAEQSLQPRGGSFENPSWKAVPNYKLLSVFHVTSMTIWRNIIMHTLGFGEMS